MNSVSLIGRLTRDPDIRYGAASQTAIARFSIAIDRMPDRNGEKKTDFPNIVCFGKTAELVEKYMSKGRLVGIQGRLQTGSYQDKDGKTVYTTDVVVEEIEFGESKKNGSSTPVFDDLQEPQAMTGSAQGNVSRGEYYELDETGLPF